MKTGVRGRRESKYQGFKDGGDKAIIKMPKPEVRYQRIPGNIAPVACFTQFDTASVDAVIGIFPGSGSSAAHPAVTAPRSPARLSFLHSFDAILKRAIKREIIRL
ncbi:hypothetical protein J6590_104087 [Homalodisca vitripennis]|nr:hypothetical protein J6590_104087 [Homalodisca vitripennis]